MSGDEKRRRADRDRMRSHERRVDALKGLIAMRSYDVPAEDVAASIIRNAIIVAAPAQRH